MVGHVVVIGAGVYGAAVTAALDRRGARVTVVDAHAPGSGTSGATFSWTNSCGKQPRAYHDLNVAGMAAHRKLGGDWYHETGNIEWADDAAGRAALRAKVAGLHDYGYPAHWLNRAETVRLEPDIDPAELPDDEIAYFPDEGWIEPTRLIAHLIATSNADVIRDDAVTAIEPNTVRLASGREIAMDAVVNCAGPRAADVAALAGLTLPMRNTKGVLLYTAPVAVAVSRVVHAPRVNLRPDGGGRLLLHSTDIDDTNGEPAAVDSVVAAARSLYPGIRDTTVADVRVGERPIPRDGLPVLGRVLDRPGCYFAVSHSGATLSVHAGDLVAAEVLGDDQNEALAEFRFERF